MDASHIHVGKIGETTTMNHLKRKGFTILGQNYRQKWGEIDIIAEKCHVVHFIEVKTVSRGTSRGFVTHETWLPEENVGRRKLQKLFRTIETWLAEHTYEGEWQLDVASVWIDEKKRTGHIKILENITGDD